MAQIDISEAEVRIWDGTLGTVTLDSVPADSDLIVTAVSKHIGSDKISIELIDPASASQSLAVAVDGRKITVDLATDTASAITSTAALIKTAIEALAGANALVTVALETAGTGVVEAVAEVSLDGQLSTEIKIGEGNVTFNEHRNVEFTRDRKQLDTVREADQEPIDLTMDATWEWINTVSGGTITLEDAVKRLNEAAAWVSTADDTCQPYCVDVEIWYAPGCGTVEDEIVMFEEFYYESVDHDLREGTLATTGRCNRTIPTSRRVLNAEIG